MLFNSLDFGVFLPIVFAIYWFLLKEKIYAQNLFLLIASYIFYGWWDWRFLSLIFISSQVDYLIGHSLVKHEAASKRKALLCLSLIVNLGILGFFKYYNFFIDNLVSSFSLFGLPISIRGLDIVLPVGISFYTFQTLSFTIDVYRKKIKPAQDVVSFFAFVSFFPQLVAGPIERASNLLPQFERKREFNYTQSLEGLRQILWGLFKKVVIADNCAVWTNEIFANHSNYGGTVLALGAVFFAFQIYGDFSGYSDIAIGTAKLFGFNLMRNFAFPYFPRDIAEFWRRWHISLTTWFRDYLYIPLGGSHCELFKNIRNVFIVFLVSGFWHGAEWTFIIWGFLNAIYFLPLMLMKRNRVHIDIVADGRLIPAFKDIISMSITFSLVCIAWVFFRAESLPHAFDYLRHGATTMHLGIGGPLLYFTQPEFLVLVCFVLFEWINRSKQFALSFVNTTLPRWARWSSYYTIMLIIILLSQGSEEFIYFTF